MYLSLSKIKSIISGSLYLLYSEKVFFIRNSKEEYAVIFVTEDIAGQIVEEIERLQKISFASITIMPAKLEKKYLGLKILRRNIEKAIGTDILFRKEVE